MAVGAHPVGRALEHQLRPIADDLTGHLIEDGGHIIPLHCLDALLALLRPFLSGHRPAPGAALSVTEGTLTA